LDIVKKREMLFGSLLTGGVGYGVYKGVIEKLKSWLFNPSQVSVHHAVNYRDVDILTGVSNSTPVRYGWRLRRGSDTVIFFIPGNSGCAMDYYDHLTTKFPGADIVCVEYPGFGWNYGKTPPPTIESCSSHVRELYDKVIYPEYKKIYVLAYSVGTVIAPRALEYCKSDKIYTFILLAPIDDISQVISYNTMIPVSMVRFILGTEPTMDYWRKMVDFGRGDIRFYVFMATNDSIVPNDRTLEVVKKLPANRTILHIVPTNHNDIICHISGNLWRTIHLK
jgi:hypothetical protein